jgi:hypothetical protein
MTPTKVTPILPQGGMIVRHYVCGRCAKNNFPTRRDAGITLHIISYKRFDTKESMVYFLQSCCICDVKPGKKEGKVDLLNQYSGSMNVIDWNALCSLFDPDDDGYAYDT